MESFPADDFSPGEFDLSEFQDRASSQPNMETTDQASHYAPRFSNASSSMSYFNYRAGGADSGNTLAATYNQSALSRANSLSSKSSDAEDSFRIETFYSTQFDSEHQNVLRNYHQQQRGLSAAHPPFYPLPVNVPAVSNGSTAENLSKPMPQKPQSSLLPSTQIEHSPSVVESETSLGTTEKPTTSLPYNNNNNSDKLMAADTPISTSKLDVVKMENDDTDGKDADTGEEGLEVDEDGEIIDDEDDEPIYESSIPEGQSPMFLNAEGQVEASIGTMPDVGFDGPDRQIFDRYTGQRDGPTNNLFYIELGEKPFKCVTCHTGFCQKSDLIIHSRIHSGERPYQCRTCGKQFISSGALLRHTRIHTGEKKYRCNECGHEFTQRSSLTRHTQTHTGERNFSCPDCGKAFATNSHLTVHIRSHTGERPYECHVCDKRFMASGNLTKHLQTNHGITTSHAKKPPSHLRAQNSSATAQRNMAGLVNTPGSVGRPVSIGGTPVAIGTPTPAIGNPAGLYGNPVAPPHRPANMNPRPMVLSSGISPRPAIPSNGITPRAMNPGNNANPRAMNSGNGANPRVMNPGNGANPRPVMPNTGIPTSTALKDNVENLSVKQTDLQATKPSPEELRGTKWDMPSDEDSEDGSPVKPQSSGLVGGSPLSKPAVPAAKKEGAFGHAMSLVFGADGTPATDQNKPPVKRGPDSDDPFDQYITKRDEFPNSSVNLPTPTTPTASTPDPATPTPGDLSPDSQPHLYTGERPYKCHICDKAYFSNSNLKRHVKTHSDASLFKCDTCEAVFTQKSGLIRHARIHSGEKPFVCTVCGKAFGESGHLTKHLRIHTGEKPYVCRICFKSFGESSNLTRHVKTHSHIRPAPQYLQNGGICTKTPEVNAVDNFIKSALSDPQDSSAPDTPTPTRGHANTSETLKVIRKQTCRTCRTWFPSVEELQGHVCRPHLTAPSGVLAALDLPPGSKPPPTGLDAPPTGNEATPTGTDAPPTGTDAPPTGDGAPPTVPDAPPTVGEKAGSESEGGEPEFKCALCQAVFPQQTQLIMHASTHSGEKMYKCEPCERYFTSSSNLRRHILLHTGEKMFACGTCDAKFSQRGSLVRHERIHTGEKPYTCNYCGKSFGTSGHLTVHTRSHTGEKPFLCKICGRCFTESGNLRKHLLKHEAGTYKGITSPMKPESVALRLQSQTTSDDSSDPTDKLIHDTMVDGATIDTGAMPPPPSLPGVKQEPEDPYMEHPGADNPRERELQLSFDDEPMEMGGASTDTDGETSLLGPIDDTVRRTIKLEKLDEESEQGESTSDNDQPMTMQLPVDNTDPEMDVRLSATSVQQQLGAMADPAPLLKVKTEKPELPASNPATDLHELWMCDRCMMMNEPGGTTCVACSKERSGMETSMQLDPSPALLEHPPVAAPTIRKTCPICNTAFTSITELKKHKKTCVKPKPDTTNTIRKTCPKCNMAFTSITELKKHKKTCVKPKMVTSNTTTTTTDSVPHSLNNAPPKLNTVPRRKKAVNVSAIPPTKAAPAANVGLENTDTSYLSNMVNVAAFKCDLCQLVFNLQKELNAHLHVHAGEKAFKCDTCEKFFSSKQTLKRHQRKHTESMFTCGLCNLQFVTKPRYEKHLIMHYGRRTFRCDHCGSAFDDNTSLLSHLRAHKLDPILHCPSYKLKDQLGRLQRIQAEEATVKRLSKDERRFRLELMDRLPDLDFFPPTPPTADGGEPDADNAGANKPGLVEVENNRCKKCHKEFHFKDNIQEHRCEPSPTAPTGPPGVPSPTGATQSSLATHAPTTAPVETATGTFKCGKCPKRFGSPKDAKRHERTHNAKKLHKCDKCGAAFNLRFSLARHQANFHGGVTQKQAKHHKVKSAGTIPVISAATGTDKFSSGLHSKKALVFNSPVKKQQPPFPTSDGVSGDSHGESDTEMDVSGCVRFDTVASGTMFDAPATPGTAGYSHKGGEPGDEDIIKALQANPDTSSPMLPTAIGAAPAGAVIESPGMPGLQGSHVPGPGFPSTPFIYTGDKPYKCVLCDKAFISRSNLKRHQKTNHYHDYLKMYNKTDITVLPRDIQPYVSPTPGPQIPAIPQLGGAQLPAGMVQFPVGRAQLPMGGAQLAVGAAQPIVGGSATSGVVGNVAGETTSVKTEPGVASEPQKFALPADEIRKLTDKALLKLQVPTDSSDSEKQPQQDDPFGQYIGERDEFTTDKPGGSGSKDTDTNTSTADGDSKTTNPSSDSQESSVDGIKNITSYSGKKPFLCSVCMSGFNQKSDLIIHYRTHTGERPYVCSVCPKNFISQSALRKHNLTHTGERNYRCMECGAEFTQKSSLQRHERVHSGERPYECSICGKRFAGSGTLTSHMRSHTGEKPYICDFCGKCYTESGSLNKHVVRHHPNNGAAPTKPFCCDYCPKTFMENGSLGKHMRHHHPQAELPPSKKFCRRKLMETSTSTVIKESVDDESGMTLPVLQEEMSDIQSDSGLDGEIARAGGEGTDTEEDGAQSDGDIPQAMAAGHDYMAAGDEEPAQSDLSMNEDEEQTAHSSGLTRVKIENISPDNPSSLNKDHNILMDHSTVTDEHNQRQQLSEEEFKAIRDRQYAMIYGKNMFMPPDESTSRETNKDPLPPLGAAAFGSSLPPQLPSPHTVPPKVSPQPIAMDISLSSPLNPHDILSQFSTHVSTNPLPKQPPSPDISQLLSPPLPPSLPSYPVKLECHGEEVSHQSTPLNLVTNQYLYPDHPAPVPLPSPGFLDPQSPSYTHQPPRTLPREPPQPFMPDKDPMRSPGIDAQSYMFQDRSLQYPASSIPSSPAPTMFDRDLQSSMYPPASQAMPFLGDIQRNFAMGSQYPLGPLPGQPDSSQYPFPFMGGSQYPPTSMPYQSMFMNRNTPYDNIYGAPPDKG